jgi:galactose mutarotase-like enzyme
MARTADRSWTSRFRTCRCWGCGEAGRAYLCIEPWQGHADAVGFAGDFREKPGVVVLPPGEPARFRMDVTVRAA